MNLLFAFVALLLAGEAKAQPELIRLGYVQCQTCHTSSYGDNLLNGYGKSVRTTLSLYQREAEVNGASNTEAWLNTNAFFRYLWIDSKSFKDQFLMQSDVNARATLKKGFGAETIVGLVPERVSKRANAPDGIIGKQFLVRRAIVDYSLAETRKLTFGRDFFARALNISDHTSYLRTANRQSVTDTPTQLRYESYTEKDLFHVAAFGPSGEENKDGREWGLFTRYERELFTQFSVAGVLTAGQTSAIRRLAPELAIRYAPSTQFGIMGAYQRVNRTLRASSTGFAQNVGYLQPYYVPLEWMMVGYSAEWLQRESPFMARSFQHGVRLQTKFISELTVLTRLDRERVSGRWGETTLTVQLVTQL